MTADPIAQSLPEVAKQLATVALTEGTDDLRTLRERHLSDAVCSVLGDRFKTTVRPRVVGLTGWPLLGRAGTDYVVDPPPGSGRPRYVGELKWCQAGQDKVHEAIWDLFKMALSTRRPGVEAAHLVTGAPVEMWPTAFCADLFDDGTFTPEELCSRRFNRGSRRNAWDWLLEGGYERFPERVPARMTTRLVGSAQIHAAGLAWELRAIAVAVGEGTEDVPFAGGWPHGNRPEDARYPKVCSGPPAAP